MVRVRQLSEVAWTLDAAAFTARMGPIGLMQQPPSERLAMQVREGRVKFTLPLPTLNSENLPALGKFEDLIVATLPAPRPDGTVQLRIGRDAGNDLIVEDPAVSGIHAAIRWDGKRGILVELGSVNGTFINRKKLTQLQTTLNNGDQLSFGLSTFVYLHAADFHALLREARV